jgi:hypothetical protein
MHCVTPFGPDRGQRVRLTDAEKLTICQIYDRQQQGGPITGNLAGYIALLDLCGVEALGSDPLPRIELTSVAGRYGTRPGLLFTRSLSVKARS